MAMEKIIFVKLLNEGTEVYRPVPAELIKAGIYKLKGDDIYNPEDEQWEFSPGTQVVVTEKFLSNGIELVAVRKLQ